MMGNSEIIEEIKNCSIDSKKINYNTIYLIKKIKQFL